MLKAVVWSTLRIFYPRQAVLGKEYLHYRGASILLINHPNTLLDALLGAVYVRQPTWFLANYSLFKHPLSSWLLSRLFCIPIQRQADTNGKPLQNEQYFAQAEKHLADGGCLLIAPEGASLPGRRIRPLKTGAARIALRTEAEFNVGMVFLPLGFTYERPHRFGGSVVIHAGAPIPARPFVKRYREDPVQAVRELTAHLEAQMKRLVVHTADEAEDKLLRQVELLWQNKYPLPLAQSYMRARQLLEAFRQWQARDANSWECFARKVRTYFSRMSARNLQDHALCCPANASALVQMMLLGLLAPLFAAVWLLHALPFHLPGLLARLYKVVPEYQSTWKYIGGLVFFLIWYIALFNLLKQYFPIGVAIGIVAVAPLAGFGAWLYARWAMRTWQRLYAWRHFQLNPELQKELREMREEIMGEMQKWVL